MCVSIYVYTHMAISFLKFYSKFFSKRDRNIDSSENKPKSNQTKKMGSTAKDKGTSG